MEHAMKKKKSSKMRIVIELIALLAAIVAIAVIAIPQLSKLLDESRQKSADNDARLVAIATQTWLTEQETKELIPAVLQDNKLSADDISQVLEIAASIDEETAKTVEITLKGSSAPACYEIESIDLTKKEFKGTATGDS